jgi:hypothetical protein
MRDDNTDLDTDTYSGGDDVDTVSYLESSTGSPGVTVTLDDFANDGLPGEGDYVTSDVEDILGSTGDDSLTGDDDANTIRGAFGTHVLIGLGGDDVLLGQEGTDFGIRGDGNDSCDVEIPVAATAGTLVSTGVAHTTPATTPAFLIMLRREKSSSSRLRSSSPMTSPLSAPAGVRRVVSSNHASSSTLTFQSFSLRLLSRTRARMPDPRAPSGSSVLIATDRNTQPITWGHACHPRLLFDARLPPKPWEGVVLVGTRIRSLGRFVAKALIVGLAFALSLFGPVSIRGVVAQGTGSVSGTVRDSNGDPVAGVRVGIYAMGDFTPFVATNGSGAYTLPGVPHSGSPYDVQLLAPCTRDQSKRVVVNGAETVNFTIPLQGTQAGYTCGLSGVPYVNGVNPLTFVNTDDGSTPVNLPFAFPFFGVNRTTAHVSTNGFLNFLAANTSNVNRALPDADTPNAAIYPFWDDLNVDGGAQVRTVSGGVFPDRFFVIEWLNVTFFNDPAHRMSAEVVLFENGRIVFNYKNIDSSPEDIRTRGMTATVGIENNNGTAAFQRLFNQPFLDNGLAFEFAPASK